MDEDLEKNDEFQLMVEDCFNRQLLSAPGFYDIPRLTEVNKDKIPEYSPSFHEIATQMRINVDILKQEITEHINREIERFKSEIAELKSK